MKTLITIFVATAAMATVPHPFVSGSPAKAADVNDNFNYLDSTVQQKASQTNVDLLSTAINAKADGSLKDSLKTRVDTGSFSAFKVTEAGDISALKAQVLGLPTSGSLGAIRDTLGRKVDTSALRQLRDTVRTKVDANWVNSAIGKLSIGGALLASSNLKDLTNADTARKSLGLGALATQSSITSSDVTTALGFTPAANAGNQGKGIFDNLNPPVGSWAFECNCGGDNSITAPISSANIQVFSTGTAYRGFQIATGYGEEDKYFLRRGSDAWQPWVEIAHSGNFKSMAQSFGIVTADGGTITGDLRISGKLTTNPGATPADYVFEPDYKLTTLSEVEAYTKANKHLPEVPSASEMTSHGVDVAAMNMVLLKKVEELTLHAIEQQKQLEAQQARLDRLEAQR